MSRRSRKFKLILFIWQRFTRKRSLVIFLCQCIVLLVVNWCRVKLLKLHLFWREFCRHYKRVYQDFFLSPDTFTNIVSRSLSGARDGNHVSIHMQFGWMLFLTLRVHILQQFSDLVTCTNALLVVMVSTSPYRPCVIDQYKYIKWESLSYLHMLHLLYFSILGWLLVELKRACTSLRKKPFFWTVGAEFLFKRLRRI